MKTQVKIIAFLMLLYTATFKAQCTSNASYPSDEEIFNVTFGTLNNSSNCSTTGGTGSIQNKYSNYAFAGFAGAVPNIDRGCSTPFSVQIGTCGGSYGNCTAIYIDWNNDGDWVDSGEKVYNSAASSTGAHTESGMITIPVTATLGNCKMRVITAETSVPTSINPCGVYNWGETEDYFVNVTNNGGSVPYVSSTVTQLTTNNVSQCTTFQQIICIPVVMGTGCTVGVLTQFQLGAGSSTNLPADVSKIHIFYTGTSNMYSAANEFVVGGTVPTGASNIINGSQTLVSNATNYFWVTYDMNMASTLGDLVDGACSQITVNGNTQTPTITDPVGSGTITSCGCSFTLGNDIVLCDPINYTLNGPTGYNTYTWSPGGAHTQNLTVSSAGDYTCSATMITGGLVTNGNFSSGNSGFSSNYVLGTGGTYGALSNPGTYSVTTNPRLGHSNFAIFGDHTTGTGNMMVCNGSAVANDIVWTQTITLTPNTNYNFSAWVASAWGPLSSGSQAQLQFSINGVLIGPIFNAPLTAGTWSNFYVNWNSGSATSAVITIVDQNITAVGANDFVLDDINFERVCSFTDIINVSSASTSTVSVPSAITACGNEIIAASSFTSSTAGVTYTWSNTNTSIGLGATGTGNTPTFTAVNSGTNSITSIITVTPSVGVCIGIPKSYTITVNPTPIIAVNSSTICSGSSTVLSAVGANNYTWSTGATTSTISVSPASNTVYTITGSSNGCSSIQTASVTITPPLSIGFTNSPVICAGISTALTATGATNYTWSTGSNTQSISVSPTSNATYTVTGETSGCTGTNTIIVTVNQTPTVTANATSSVICMGNSTILNGGGASTYTWSGGVTDGTAFSPTSTVSYTVLGTSVQGCTNTAVQTITVNNIPTLSVNNAIICSGTSTVLTVTGASNYTWSTGATTQNLNVSPTSNTTYTVTGETFGCTGINTVVVTVNQTPTVTANAINSVICSGNSTTLNGGGASSYTWTGSVANGIAFFPTSTASYTVTGTSAQGCINTAVQTITVNNTPTLSINNAIICAGTSTALIATGATNYTWSTGANTQSISIAPSSSTIYTVTGETSGCTRTNTIIVTVNQTPTVTANATNSVICSGNSTILNGGGASAYIWSGGVTNGIAFSPTSTVIYTVIGTSAQGCTNTAVQTVTVKSAPTLTVNNASVCQGASIVLSALGATNYTWSTGATTSTISPSTVATSVYTVTGESNGCAIIKTATLTVNPTPLLSVNNSAICSGTSTTLTAMTSIIGGTYTWSPGNQHSSSISLSPISSNNYTVMYSVNGCSASAVSNVTVNSVPQVSITSVSICKGETAVLKATPSQAGGTYLWGPSGQTNQSITETPFATSVYGVLYSLNGCTATATGSIVVNQNPILVLTSSASTVVPLDNVTISGSSSGNFLWSTGETSSEITVNPRNTTSYCATVTNTAGCKTTACLEIIVMDESTLYVPNVFTPNGDGVNDVFYTPSHNIEMYDLNIFNRWGQLLFNSTDPGKGWDGQFEGQLVADGVYIFILKARGTDNIDYNKTGHITVFK